MRAYPHAIPARQSSRIVTSPRPSEGASHEAFVMAGRGAAPAGSCTRHGHPGGAGLPRDHYLEALPGAG